VQLTEQQQAGLDKVAAWYSGTRQDMFTSDVFRWFGYAGTGKTFTAARIPETLGLTKVVFGTYTGKAASVLRKSLARYSWDGTEYPVSTIHSAIYFPTTSMAAKEALDECREKISAAREALLDTTMPAEVGMLEADIKAWEAQLPTLEANARRLRWEFNPDGPWADADLIILDEVSMVNAKLAADSEAYGVPVLVLGDPAQLPPVEGGGYYTDAQPDHLLTEIQRAALDSPVTSLATRVRQSSDNWLGMTSRDMEPPSLRAAMEADVVLCWSNRRRWAMINAIRTKRAALDGRGVADRPVPGDTIMVLTNNKDMAVFNGEIFEVISAQSQESAGYVLEVRGDTGQVREMQVYPDGFQGLERPKAAKNVGLGMRGQRALATFAQAITVHKAQGSEWDHVYVVNETPGMMAMTAQRAGQRAAIEQARAWLYTAVTRAKEKVSITLPK